MGESTIPVDLFNPGQVFACLGFLEAADILCGNAEGGFDWRNGEDTFTLKADGEENPVAEVLAFLAGAEVCDFAPEGWKPKKEPSKEKEKIELEMKLLTLGRQDFFPAPSPDGLAALPVKLNADNKQIILHHWTDGSSRDDFKLYAGNRSALGIAKAMLEGTRGKPKKSQNIGDLITKGVVQLWEENSVALILDPFATTTPMGGSFNFDPRGAWTAIDAGYSPNDQKHQVEASPVVEILAAWGLEHARPDEFERRQVRYSVWGTPLAPILARAALAGGSLSTIIPYRYFIFTLLMSGKNKVVQFAEEETSQ